MGKNDKQEKRKKDPSCGPSGDDKCKPKEKKPKPAKKEECAKPKPKPKPKPSKSKSCKGATKKVKKAPKSKSKCSCGPKSGGKFTGVSENMFQVNKQVELSDQPDKTTANCCVCREKVQGRGSRQT